MTDLVLRSSSYEVTVYDWPVLLDLDERTLMVCVKVERRCRPFLETTRDTQNEQGEPTYDSDDSGRLALVQELQGVLSGHGEIRTVPIDMRTGVVNSAEPPIHDILSWAINNPVTTIVVTVASLAAKDLYIVVRDAAKRRMGGEDDWRDDSGYLSG